MLSTICGDSAEAARQTMFTHLTHSVLYARDARDLPDNISLGCVGMTFDVE